jgi:hypothetical protein
MDEQALHPDFCNNDESYEKKLLEESEKIYKEILDDSIIYKINSPMDKSISSFQAEIQLSAERKYSQKQSDYVYGKKEHTFI